MITGEEIRRSGVTSLPEALRLVNSLHVARQSQRTWAISARGFNSATANKMLVLIDGRSVYTPLFSGVFWDVQDVLLEDVERIEVIRGPGATLWGANAVNGVINVITKPAADTQGGLVDGGRRQRGARASAAARYGGTLGERGHYRVYGKYVDRDALGLRGRRRCARRHVAGPGRLPRRLEDRGRRRVDRPGRRLHGPDRRAPASDDSDVDGGNLLGRWSRPLAERLGPRAAGLLGPHPPRHPRRSSRSTATPGPGLPARLPARRSGTT